MSTELSPQPIGSIPIRMPGQVVSVSSNLPTFIVSLRGQGDKDGIFEKNQEEKVWNSNSIHYTLGRIVYDFILDEKERWGDARERDPEKDKFSVRLAVKYSVLGHKPNTKDLALMIKLWEFDFQPGLWFKLPPVSQPFFGVRVHTPVPFRLAVAGIPVSVFSTRSKPDVKDDTCQVLEFSTIPLEECQHVMDTDNDKNDNTTTTTAKYWLNYERIFGAWLVFDSNPFRVGGGDKDTKVIVDYFYKS